MKVSNGHAPVGKFGSNAPPVAKQVLAEIVGQLGRLWTMKLVVPLFLPLCDDVWRCLCSSPGEDDQNYGRSPDRRRHGSSVAHSRRCRRRGFAANRFTRRNFLLVFGSVYVLADPCHDIARAIYAREAGIENELCHPRRGLNLGLENIRLKREQKSLFQQV